MVDRTAGEGSDLSEDIDVELVKKPGKGLGLSVVGRRNGTGVFISDMVSSYLAIISIQRAKNDNVCNCVNVITGSGWFS